MITIETRVPEHVFIDVTNQLMIEKDFVISSNDPIDRAIIEAAYLAGLSARRRPSPYPRG